MANDVSKQSVLGRKRQRSKQAIPSELPTVLLWDLPYFEDQVQGEGSYVGSEPDGSCPACHPYPCSCDLATSSQSDTGFYQESAKELSMGVGLGDREESQRDGISPTRHAVGGVCPEEESARVVGRENLLHKGHAEGQGGICNEAKGPSWLPGQRLPGETEPERREVPAYVKGFLPRLEREASDAAAERRRLVDTGASDARRNRKWWRDGRMLAERWK